MLLDNFTYYIIIVFSFVLAGILKGATGAGAPIITIPVISAFYDVRFFTEIVEKKLSEINYE